MDRDISVILLSVFQDLISLCKAIDLFLLEEKLEENRKKDIKEVSREKTL